MPILRRILFLLVILLSVVAGKFAIAKGTSDSDQLDVQDRQEFNLHIDRANTCTQSRDFVCAEKQLGQAKSYANGSSDRNVLQKAMESLELQRQLTLRDDAKQKYAGEREVIATNAENSERELAEARRRDIAASRQRSEIAARKAEQREEMRQQQEPQPSLMDEINQTTAKNLAILSNIDRQTKEAYATTNRVLASQATDRKREENERASQRRRDDERDRNTRLASADAQRERDKRAEQAQVREQEQRHQREEQAAAENRAREQEQARLQEEKRQKEAKDAADRQAEQKRKSDYLAALKQGVRLHATKCMGGEGKYYVTGNKPAGLKNQVSCVDVFFQARCTGNAVSSRGVLGNFIGMSGCLGDLKEIDPKPDCPIEQVQVEVTDVQATCNHGW